MNGDITHLTCCDRDCAEANGCRIGGYQCNGCGRWFCAEEINESGFCDSCEVERVEMTNHVDTVEREMEAKEDELSFLKRAVDPIMTCDLHLKNVDDSTLAEYYENIIKEVRSAIEKVQAK